jgi:hypothetical protein
LEITVRVGKINLAKIEAVGVPVHLEESNTGQPSLDILSESPI